MAPPTNLPPPTRRPPLSPLPAPRVSVSAGGLSKTLPKPVVKPKASKAKITLCKATFGSGNECTLQTIDGTLYCGIHKDKQTPQSKNSNLGPATKKLSSLPKVVIETSAVSAKTTIIGEKKLGKKGEVIPPKSRVVAKPAMTVVKPSVVTAKNLVATKSRATVAEKPLVAKPLVEKLPVAKLPAAKLPAAKPPGGTKSRVTVAEKTSVATKSRVAVAEKSAVVSAKPRVATASKPRGS
jgi:hypothetical protein